MVLKVLNIFFILIIAIPFIYIFVDVMVDIFRRTFGFFRLKTKPALVNILSLYSK